MFAECFVSALGTGCLGAVLFPLEEMWLKRGWGCISFPVHWRLMPTLATAGKLLSVIPWGH